MTFDPKRWRPDPLLVIPDRSGFIVSDAYLAFRTKDLSPWGVDGVGTYRRGKRLRDPYDRGARPGFVAEENTGRFGKQLAEWASMSEAEAWPLAADAQNKEGAIYLPKNSYDQVPWLWTNEEGELLCFNAKFLSTLVALMGVGERELSFTCAAQSSPMFAWEGSRWLGAVMPMRLYNDQKDAEWLLWNEASAA